MRNRIKNLKMIKIILKIIYEIDDEEFVKLLDGFLIYNKISIEIDTRSECKFSNKYQKVRVITANFIKFSYIKLNF